MTTAEGKTYKFYLRIAGYVCDYDEARNLSCVYNQRCYHCELDYEDRGRNVVGKLRDQKEYEKMVR